MRRPTRGAFTLIELLVALAIVAIMSAGVAIPLFLSNSDDHKLRDATRRLTDMVQFCNSMAVFESSSYRLYFDPPAGQCAVAVERFPQDEPGVYSLYEASGFSLYTLPEGVTFTDLIIESDGEGENESEEESASETSDTNEEDPYIEFRRDGTADNASFVLNCGTRYLGVTISGLTSAVRLIENPAVEATQDQEQPLGAPTPQTLPGLDVNNVQTETDDSFGAEFHSDNTLQDPPPGEMKNGTLRDRLTRSTRNSTEGGSRNTDRSRPMSGATRSGAPKGKGT